MPPFGRQSDLEQMLRACYHEFGLFRHGDAGPDPQNLLAPILTRLGAISDQLDDQQRQLDRLEHKIMAISPQVQAVLDAINANTSLVASVDAALKAEADQITALLAQVADLQAQIAAGTSLSADDIAGLATGLQNLSDTNTKLQADVPANTPPATPAP